MRADEFLKALRPFVNGDLEYTVLSPGGIYFIYEPKVGFERTVAYFAMVASNSECVLDYRRTKELASILAGLNRKSEVNLIYDRAHNQLAVGSKIGAGSVYRWVAAYSGADTAKVFEQLKRFGGDTKRLDRLSDAVSDRSPARMFGQETKHIGKISLYGDYADVSYEIASSGTYADFCYIDKIDRKWGIPAIYATDGYRLIKRALDGSELSESIKLPSKVLSTIRKLGCESLTFEQTNNGCTAVLGFARIGDRLHRYAIIYATPLRNFPDCSRILKEKYDFKVCFSFNDRDRLANALKNMVALNKKKPYFKFAISGVFATISPVNGGGEVLAPVSVHQGVGNECSFTFDGRYLLTALNSSKSNQRFGFTSPSSPIYAIAPDSEYVFTPMRN